MASFETHLSVATVVLGVITIPLLASSVVNPYEAIVLLFFGVMGTISPDLDSNNSTPINIAFKIMSLILPLLFIFNFSNDLTLFQILLSWIISTIGLRLLFKYLFLRLTVHRGIFHTISMGILFGETTCLIMLNALEVNTHLSILAGAYVTLGFLIHLLLDEIYSVNLLGIELKKSFGTAFKLYYRKNILGSVIVNTLAIVLFFFIPEVSVTLMEAWELLSSTHIY